MKESGEFFIGGGEEREREREGGEEREREGGEEREREGGRRERERGGEEREREGGSRERGEREMGGGRGYTSLPALSVPHHFIIIITSLLIYKG